MPGLLLAWWVGMSAVFFSTLAHAAAPAISAQTLTPAAATTAAAPSKKSIPLTEPIPVLASFGILADVAQAIGGERARVSSLLPAGADSHSYQPAPGEVKKLSDARLLIINGLGFDNWAQRLAESSQYRGTLLVASTGIKPITQEADEAAHNEEADHQDDAGDHDAHHHHAHDHGRFDPHIWQDPVLMQHVVENIARALGKLDPAGAAYYRSNAQGYSRQLQGIAQQSLGRMKKIPSAQRKIVTSHDAFAYLARRLGIRMYPVHGVSTEEAASAQRIAEVVRIIRREKVAAIFLEHGQDPRLIEQLSRETGVPVDATLYADTLSSPGGPAENYLALLRHNLDTLITGMQRNAH